MRSLRTLTPVHAAAQRSERDDEDGVGAAVRVGVLGAVLTVLCSGTLMLLALPPFLPADESAHAAYALAVSDGRLPVLDEEITPEIPGQKTHRLFLANHPPLYYALVGPVLEWGVDSGHPIAGVRLVRGFSLALCAVTVGLTALIAGFVARRRRAQAMVLAAGLAATVPTFVSTSVLLHNDSLAVMSATLAFLGGVAALCDGPQRRYVVLVCVGAGITMATRLNGLVVVALACLGLALAAAIYDEGRLIRRLLRGGALALFPVLAALATSGWFYLRNIRIYGDAAGVSHNRELGGRQDTFTPLSYLTDRLSLPDLLTRVENGGPWRDPRSFGWYDRKLLAVVVVTVAIGAAWFALDAFRRRQEARDASRRGRVVAAAIVVALPILLWVQLSGFVAQTGTANPRYLFPGVPAVAVVVAVFCLGFPGRAGVLVGVAVMTFQLVLGLTTLGRWISWRIGGPRLHPVRQLHGSLATADIPAPWVALGLLFGGALAGIGLQAWALWTTESQAAKEVELVAA